MKSPRLVAVWTLLRPGTGALRWLAAVALVVTTPVGHAQTFTTIKSFGNITNIIGIRPQSTLVQGPDGTLYGTTSDGQGSVAGTVFKIQPDGSGFTVLKWLTNSSEGASPLAGLTLSGSVLYGTTFSGGSSNYGTVFRVNTDGTAYTVLKNFTGSDGANPAWAGLTLAGSTLYGATYYGGNSNSGTLFKLNTDGTGFATLHRFAALDYYTNTGVFYYANSEGANPGFSLTLAGSVLYGTAQYGGISNYGTVFKLNTDGTGFTVLKNFAGSPDGAYPDTVLTLSGSVLYGTTFGGGSYVGSYYNDGTVFRINTDGTGYAILKTFTGSLDDGANPSGPLALSSNVLYGTTLEQFGNGTVFKLNTDGTGFSVLKNFGGYPDAGNPYAGVMLSSNMLYGTTDYGGSSGGGTVFKVNTDGTGYTVLENFAGSAGGGPLAGLTLAGDVLYGTTGGDGKLDYGTVFQVNTDGTGYTVLKSFANSDGASPYSDMTLSEGFLYGTTLKGGSSNYGTMFRINADGTGFSVLKNFAGGDGANPYCSLALADSVLYGTTWGGGSSNKGTLFKVNTDGTGYIVLKNFPGSPDGAYPAAGLTLSGGVLYGTTYYGGSSGNNYAVGDGTVFKVNTDGTGYIVLRNFTGSPDGAQPAAGLTFSGGVLYGTTYQGGSSYRGTVFKLNIDGTGYAVLKSFTGSDGEGPLAGLTLLGSVLYGTTFDGGASGNGTLFRLNTDGSGYTVVKNFTGSDGAQLESDLTVSGTMLYGTTSGGGAWGNGSVFSLSFAPQLTIALAGANVILTWPTNNGGFDYTGYTLQSATNMNPPVVWSTNSPAPVIINGQLTVTNPIAGTQRFYRLVR